MDNETATLAPKIAQAKSAGYSDAEIVNFLSAQSPKFKQATAAGYSPAEIVDHVSHALPAITVSPDEEKPAAKPAETDDHGLARRQKMTQAELAVSPITEWPRNYDEMLTDARHQMSRGLGQLQHSFGEAKGDLSQPGELANLWEGTKGVGNVGLGALSFLASPVSAAYRSVLGQPVEDITGVPREYTEFAAQLATPGIGFGGKAPIPGEAPVIPRGYRTGPEPPPPAPPSDVAQAAQRLDVKVPRAVSSDSRTTQSFGQGASKLPIVGGPVAQAVEDVGPQLARARTQAAEEFGSGTAPNAAARIEQHLTRSAEEETQATQAAADARDQAATAEWQRANQEREAGIAEQERQAAQAAQQRVGPDLAPPDMGEVVINRVRNAEQAARNQKDALYREAGGIEATVLDDANAGLHQDVQADLRSDAGGQGRVDLSGVATSAARSMMRRVQQFSRDARQRIATAQQEAVDGGGAVEDAAQTGRSMRDVEGLRQDLNFLASGASNDADRRAARRIMNAFDDWHSGSVESHLMEGSDPRALPAMRAARDANRDWRQRFGYNGRDDADKLVNKIVRGEEDQHTGPNAVSDALTAGNDKSGPLFSRVMEATDGHPDVLQAVRSGTWNKLSRTPEGVTPRAPEKIASDIYQHLYGKGRDVAGRVFTPEQQGLMRAHADTLRQGVAQRDIAEGAAKATKPVPTKVEPGPIQQLADSVIGGGKSDEALFRTIEGYAKSKNLGGDIETLAEVMRRIPPEMKGDFVHSFINRLGVSKKTGEFSPNIFASEWENITPQVKAVLFGNAGNHIQSLNDIAAISRRMEQVQSKFGNPSGSGFTLNFSHGLAALVTGVLSGHPMAALSAVGTGTVGLSLSRILASPQGAASVARFSRAVERMNNKPTINTASAARATFRDVVNTARAIDTTQKRK